MAQTEERERTLTMDERTTVRDVIVICRQLIREERWHRRIARSFGKARRFDWAAWRFRLRMRLAHWRSSSSTAVTRIVQAEIDRVSRLIDGYNKDVPREHHVRGKVVLPRGIFIVNQSELRVPDSIDIVWPRRAKP